MTGRQDSQQRLRDAGLRVTSPRIAVLQALDEIDGHVTAEQIRQLVLARLGSVSVQTIYDILAALTAAGLVRCLETPGQPARFEIRVGDNHHHFICRGCGKTIDIDCAVGERPCLIPQGLPPGFEADEADVTYWGTCSDCRPEVCTAPFATRNDRTTKGGLPEMNCLSCARTGAERTAVALCPHCHAGLCLDHVRETANDPGPGGMLLSCGHHTWDSAWQLAQGSDPQESSVASDRHVTN